MTRRALITGIAGQDGSYLAEWLLAQGYEVHGLAGPLISTRAAALLQLADRVCLHDVDLQDERRLRDLLARTRPDEFYNLAALSFVPDSSTQAVAAAELNALAVLKILEAIRVVRPTTRFFQANSSLCFGRPATTPQNELTPFQPDTPYAAGKAYAHWLTVSYRELHGLFACNGILFNHESPRRAPAFVTRKITRGATAIKRGLARHLSLGNLQSRRDWGYAGDFVQAMWRMLQQDRPDDFVIGTGVTHTVAEFAEAAFRHVGLAWRDHVVTDPTLYRPTESFVLAADARKARQQLGWEPATTFEQLVTMMVDADLRCPDAEVAPAPDTAPGGSPAPGHHGVSDTRAG